MSVIKDTTNNTSMNPIDRDDTCYMKNGYAQWHEIIHLSVNLGAQCLHHLTKNLKNL